MIVDRLVDFNDNLRRCRGRLGFETRHVRMLGLRLRLYDLRFNGRRGRHGRLKLQVVLGHGVVKVLG